MEKLINLGHSVVLHDVTDSLFTKRKPRRRVTDIEYLFVHHSGAEGSAGFSGLENSVRYVTSKRGFSGPAYTFWIPRDPEVDDTNNVIIYRCTPDTHIGAHTRGVNDVASAVCLQGNMHGLQPSAVQYHALYRLANYLQHELYPNLSKVLPHSGADTVGGKSKAACPGKELEDFCLWLNTIA